MPHHARGAACRLAPVFLSLLLLAACQPTPTPQTGPAPAAAPEAAAAPDPAPAAERDPNALIRAANAAMSADRMFQPHGDNALELYLQALELDPEHRRARAGLVDILPFVLIGLEQRLTAGDLAEAERLLRLFRQADGGHPALPRLDARLRAALDQQAEAERLRQLAEREAERRAAQQAELAQSAPSQAPSPAPSPVAAAPAATLPASPEPVAQVASAAPAVAEPAVAAPQPSPAVDASSAPTRAVGGALPPIVAQYSPRYPPQAQRRRLEGLVEVEFTVRADGSVGEVRVLRSEPQGVFDREAIGAMQRWRFQATGREITARRVFDFKLGET
jgi:periplasmic protein TonB